MLADVARLSRFCASAWRFLGDPLTTEQARTVITERLAVREASFLECVAAIQAHPASPYARLLEHAGVERGDVAKLVGELGIEGALARLYDAGVYTTTAELKGDAPIVRGSFELHATYADFNNPAVTPHMIGSSGGTGGRPRPQIVNLATSMHASAHLRLFGEAFDVLRRPMALWYPCPPAQGGFLNGFSHLHAGFRIERWFAQTPWLQPGLMSSGATVLAGFGVSHLRRQPLPFPRHLPPLQAGKVARWLADKKRAGTPAYLAATPSSAVRVAQAADTLGLDVAGTMFRCGGEPLTPAKAAAIERTGGRSVSFYFASEASGLISTPCAEGVAPDDGHLCEEKLAALVRTRELPDGSTVDSLLLTSVFPRARNLLINWESGDTAVLTRRPCGCPFGALGLTTHLHGIQSYEKLTSEGVTFAGGSLVTLVEEVLPQRFGGRPTSYQLVEREIDGVTRMQLRVSPSIGVLDEAAVLEETLRYLAGQGGGEILMTAVWRAAGTVEVVREEPHVTNASKTPALYRAR